MKSKSHQVLSEGLEPYSEDSVTDESHYTLPKDSGRYEYIREHHVNEHFYRKVEARHKKSHTDPQPKRISANDDGYLKAQYGDRSSHLKRERKLPEIRT